MWPVSAVSQDDVAPTDSAMLIRIAAEDNWPPFSDHQGKGLSEQHKHRFKRIEVSTHAQLIGLLNTNKLDLAIFFDDVLHYYLQHEGIKAQNVQRGQLNYTSEIYLAFTKDNPHSIRRAEALDAGIDQLKKSGEYQRLLNRIRPSFTKIPKSAKEMGR